LFGGLQRDSEAARAEAEAAQDGTRISIAADAADAYFQLRGDQARLAVAQRQVETDAHLLDLVRLRNASGIGSDRETAQAQALLEQAKTTIPPLRIDLEAQLNRLDVLMGAQPGTYAGELAVAADIPPSPPFPAPSRSMCCAAGRTLSPPNAGWRRPMHASAWPCRSII
jgi:outer membrane protein TolC